MSAFQTHKKDHKEKVATCLYCEEGNLCEKTKKYLVQHKDNRKAKRIQFARIKREKALLK